MKPVNSFDCSELRTPEVLYIFIFEKPITFLIFSGFQKIYMYGIVMTNGIRCDYQICKNVMFEEINGPTVAS